jgi:2-oxoglutarate ferredoxin oxidoreductase subunit beta
MPLKKWEALSKEEQLNIFPTGVLRQVEQDEYCDMYAKIIAAAQGKGPKITQDDFVKKM